MFELKGINEGLQRRGKNAVHSASAGRIQLIPLSVFALLGVSLVNPLYSVLFHQ